MSQSPTKVVCTTLTIWCSVCTVLRLLNLISFKCCHIENRAYKSSSGAQKCCPFGLLQVLLFTLLFHLLTMSVLLSAVSCGRPKRSSFQVMDGINFSFPHSVTFSCLPGFVLQGEDRLSCQANGSWNTSVPVCVPISCERPSIPGHAHVLSLNVTYNGSLELYCNRGYQAAKGHLVYKCDSRGSWIPRDELVCKGMSVNVMCVKGCMFRFYTYTLILYLHQLPQ